MRIMLAVALGLILGACADSGPEVHGIWDLVSINGEPLPTQGMAQHWVDVKEGGVVTLYFIPEGESEPQSVEAEYSLGEVQDGCIAYNSNDYRTGEPLVGSVCGDVLTLNTVDGVPIIYSRRM
jgi:hypothetical protein